MARCFPYTPGSRDRVAETMAAAAVEPAADKLQKEREMMQKKERKKEKRSQKRGAQMGDKYEKSDHDHQSKHGHKKRKHDSHIVVGLETGKVLKDSVEQFEKSGLSEEYKAPSNNQALHGTLESSLDSSKRLRATTLSASSSRNGVFRVKLAPMSQRRDLESTSGMAMKPRVLEQPSVKEMGRDLFMANKQSEFKPHINTVTAVKQLVAQQKVVMQRATTKVMQGVETTPAKVMQSAGHLMPSKVFQKEATQVTAKVSKKATGAEQTALLNKPKLGAVPLVVKEQRRTDAPDKEEPCSSGSILAEIPTNDAQQANSDRKSRKAEKEERKYADLFANWRSSPTQMDDVGDQDWLFSCGATPKSDWRTFDGSARCQPKPTEWQFSLQPRAVYLPDLHMYQLPSVVPF